MGYLDENIEGIHRVPYPTAHLELILDECSILSIGSYIGSILELCEDNPVLIKYDICSENP